MATSAIGEGIAKEDIARDETVDGEVVDEEVDYEEIGFLDGVFSNQETKKSDGLSGVPKVTRI